MDTYAEEELFELSEISVEEIFNEDQLDEYSDFGPITLDEIFN